MTAPTLANYANDADLAVSPELSEHTLTSSDVRKRLGYKHVSSVLRLSRDVLPYVTTPGRHRRYRPEDVDALVARLERGERLEPVDRED